eukprot:4785243-Prymnesium_polylepis.2
MERSAAGVDPWSPCCTVARSCRAVRGREQSVEGWAGAAAAAGAAAVVREHARRQQRARVREVRRAPS